MSINEEENHSWCCSWASVTSHDDSNNNIQNLTHHAKFANHQNSGDAPSVGSFSFSSYASRGAGAAGFPLHNNNNSVRVEEWELVDSSIGTSTTSWGGGAAVAESSLVSSVLSMDSSSSLLSLSSPPCCTRNKVARTCRSSNRRSHASETTSDAAAAAAISTSGTPRSCTSSSAVTTTLDSVASRNFPLTRNGQTMTRESSVSELSQPTDCPNTTNTTSAAASCSSWTTIPPPPPSGDIVVLAGSRNQDNGSTDCSTSDTSVLLCVPPHQIEIPTITRTSYRDAVVGGIRRRRRQAEGAWRLRQAREASQWRPTLTRLQSSLHTNRSYWWNKEPRQALVRAQEPLYHSWRNDEKNDLQVATRLHSLSFGSIAEDDEDEYDEDKDDEDEADEDKDDDDDDDILEDYEHILGEQRTQAC